MLGAIKDAEASQTVGGQFILWQHALDGVLDCNFWIFFDNFLKFQFGQTAGETAVAIIHFINHLVTSNLNILGIDNDDIVTIVDVWGESSFAFTHQLVGDDHSELAEWHAAGVNQIPFAADFWAFLAISFHLFPLLFG